MNPNEVPGHEISYGFPTSTHIFSVGIQIRDRWFGVDDTRKEEVFEVVA